MNITSATSLSGMNAAQTFMQASASNIANLATPGFNRQEVKLSAESSGGVVATISTGSTGSTGTQLEKDVVQQLQAKNAFLANLAVFKVNNDVMGTLLNVKA